MATNNLIGQVMLFKKDDFIGKAALRRGAFDWASRAHAHSAAKAAAPTSAEQLTAARFLCTNFIRNLVAHDRHKYEEEAQRVITNNIPAVREGARTEGSAARRTRDGPGRVRRQHRLRQRI